MWFVMDTLQMDIDFMWKGSIMEKWDIINDALESPGLGVLDGFFASFSMIIVSKVVFYFSTFLKKIELTGIIAS